MVIVRALACLLLTSFTTGSHAVAALQSCSGCAGAGDFNSDSGGSCGGTLSIEVDVEDGKCRWFLGYEDWILRCGQQKGCKPTVTRTWAGMPANTSLDFCITIGADILCTQPPPMSGAGGSGEDTRASAQIPCSDSPFTYSIGSASCGLSTSATATCSSCDA